MFSHFKTNFKMDLKVCTEAMGVLSYTKYSNDTNLPYTARTIHEYSGN